MKAARQGTARNRVNSIARSWDARAPASSPTAIRLGEQRDLGAGGADRRGPERPEEAPDIVVQGEAAKRRQAVAACEIGADHRGLEAACDEHAPRRRVACVRKERGEGECRHHRQIEQDRRRRGRGEALQRVENAAIERDEAHQQQIGKGDAGELDGNGEAVRVFPVAGGQQRDHRGREQQREREQRGLHGDQHGEDAIGEQARGVGAALVADARIGGNERRVERPFREDGAEMVRQPQRDEERIGDRAGAENRRQHDVAHEAGHARQQRETTDGQNAIEHPVSASRRDAPHSLDLKKCHGPA
jgi:hypothetical protein